MKQTLQKILNFIDSHRMVALALLLAFMIPSLTQAANGTRVTMENGGTYYLDNYMIGRKNITFVQRDDKKDIYYCLDRGLQGASNTSYTTFSDPEIGTLPDLSAKVLAAGYPNKSIPGFSSVADQYYITQVTLWATATKHNLDWAPSNQYAGLEYTVIGADATDKAKAAKVLQATKDLMARAQKLTAADLESSIALTGSDNFALKGENLVAGPFTVTGKNISGVSLTVSVSGANNIRVYGANSQTLTTVGYNQPFYVSFPKAGNAKTGKVTINLSGTKTVLTPMRYSPPTPHYQYLARFGGREVSQSLSKAATWNLPIEGSVEITKSDVSTGAPVPGATIEIYNAAGTKIFGGVTNSQGKITVASLGVGKYTFKETIAPSGYEKTTEVGVFEIKQDGVIVKAKLTNKRVPDTPVVIIKQDRADGKVLAGAKIEVYNSSNARIFAGTTSASGEVNVGSLKAGSYSYKEVTPPAGYKPNNELHKFTITAGQSAIKLYIKNDQIPVIPDTPVQIIKVDKDTKKPLAGATIEVYDAKNAKIFTGATTADGKVQVGKLKAGKYTYKETVAPTGYKLNTEVYEFTIKAGDETTILTLTNEVIPVGKIQITKTDLTTAAPLAGATIEIYDANGKNVYTSVSTETGLVETELVAGKYTFKETIAPEGYELSTEVGQFEIKQNGEIVKAEMKNKPLPNIPVTPPELPKTGPIEALAALVGIGSVTLAIAYWHKSNQALKKAKH